MNTPNDLDDPQPGAEYTFRVAPDASIAPPGSLVTIRVLFAGELPAIGSLGVFDDGTDVIIARVLGWSARWWHLERFMEFGFRDPLPCTALRSRYEAKGQLTIGAGNS